MSFLGFLSKALSALANTLRGREREARRNLREAQEELLPRRPRRRPRPPVVRHERIVPAAPAPPTPEEISEAPRKTEIETSYGHRIELTFKSRLEMLRYMQRQAQRGRRAASVLIKIKKDRDSPKREEEIREKYRDPYKRAQALREYRQSNYTYVTAVPHTVISSQREIDYVNERLLEEIARYDYDIDSYLLVYHIYRGGFFE